jgi:hypothetical protein
VTEGSPEEKNERLSLRWAFIVFVSLGAGIVAGYLGGPLAGWGTGLGTVAVLYKIVGN